jgi:hypothetical protein
MYSDDESDIELMDEFELVNDSESSDEYEEVVYPDASEVYWSDAEESNFHERDSSRCSPILRRRRTSLLCERAVYQSTSPINNDGKTVNPINHSGDCSICLMKMDVTDKNTVYLYCSSQCGNIFHKRCMQMYTKPKRCNFCKCPLCRTCSTFLELKKNSVTL